MTASPLWEGCLLGSFLQRGWNMVPAILAIDQLWLRSVDRAKGQVAPVLLAAYTVAL